MPRPKVFVSHSSIDNIFASVLVEDLNESGADAWLDKKDLRAGDFQANINAALAKCDWFVLVLTQHALASPWVKQEVNAANRLKNQGRINNLIVIQAKPVDQDKIPPMWGVYNIFDAQEPDKYQLALEQTLQELELLPSGKTSALVSTQVNKIVPARFVRGALFTVLLCLFVVAGVSLRLGSAGLISNVWANTLIVAFVAVGVIVLGAMVWYFQLTPSGRTLRARATAAQSLFTALKQSKVRDSRIFNLDALPVVIPLTVRDYENPLDSPGRPISKAYEASHDLLILGEPGSGKTTLLQQLALELMNKEIRIANLTEQATRLPVFLSLHGWAKKKKPLKSWIRQQFRDKFSAQGLYSVHGLSRSLVNHWLRRGNFILLLDGLDEMSEQESRECIAAITRLRSQILSPLVISCEQGRYERLAGSQHPLNLGQKTVVVQSVTPSQARDYFADMGATRLAQIAQQAIDQSLHVLPHTPLLLNVLAQTYPDDSQYWKASASRNWQTTLDVSEIALMRAYVNHAIEAENTRYGGQDLRYWLTQLANRMGDNQYFQFRAHYLPSSTAKVLYVATTWLAIALIAGLACLPVSIGTFSSWQLLAVFALIAGVYGYLQFLPIITLIPGLYGFLLKSVVSGVFMAVLYVLTVALSSFSFASSGRKSPLQKLGAVLITYMIILLPVILLTVALILGAQVIGVPAWLAVLSECLVGGLLWYSFYRVNGLQAILKSGNKSSVLYTWLTVVYMMMARLIDPIAPDTLSPRDSTPRAFTRGVGVGIATGLVIWSAGFIFWHTNLLLAAMLLGTSVWLDRGLGASLRGYILRFWFRRYRILPWSPRYLDDAIAAGLLEEHGGSFRFVYGSTLQGYFHGKSPS